MPKDKYPSIFLPQMEAIVFMILQIFFTMHIVLKIGEYSWNIRSFDVFRPIMREQKYLMDCNLGYHITELICLSIGHIWM